MSPLVDQSPVVPMSPLWTRPLRRGPRPDFPVDFVRPGLTYSIARSVERTIVRHAVGTVALEVGGLLLGEVYETDGGYYVYVSDALEARYTQASAVSLMFTGQTWIDLMDRRAGFPDRRTVGWYHSHPGMGVFFSGADSFAHGAFFGDEPWYVALVIDPIVMRLGAFVWDDDRVHTLRGLSAASQFRPQ